MKIHSYTICHYGKDYITSALQSVLPFVEQAHIFYTPHPSHGHKSDVMPIEGSSDIFNEIWDFTNSNVPFDSENQNFLNPKIQWHDTNFSSHEGNQRDYCVEYLRKLGVDIILVLDYDEVWPAQTLQRALEIVEAGDARNWLVNMTHLWRSFNYACKDEGWPVRFIDLRQSGDGVGYIPKETGDIYHFGYAITDEVMRYKWEIHGHKNEMRPGWLDEEWAKFSLQNCHPTNGRNEKGEAFWDAAPFDKRLLPDFMKQHPFYNLGKIK